jgi:O-antigen/teichoic acid export membrane protein
LLKRLFKSIVAIISGQFLNVLGNAILVPMFLSRWSTGVYGEWMALSAVVAYFGVTDLGMNSAAANAMTATYARGDLIMFRDVQASALAFYLGMAFTVSVCVGVLMFIFPIPAWIGIKEIPSGVAAWVTWLLAARLLWQMPAAQLGSIYRATGNLAAMQWFGNLQSIGLLVVTAGVLLLHGGVLQQAIWGAVPMIVVTAGAWFSLRRSRPELLPQLSRARLAGVRGLLAPSLLFAIIMVSMALTIQGPVVLVSKVLGGVAVALLVTTRTLANVVKQMVAPVQLALWPELTRLDALGADESLRLGHRFLAVASIAVCAAFAGAIWFEGASVVSVWTGGRLSPDIWLLRFLLLALVLQAPWLASSLFTLANNQHRRLAYSYASSAVLTLTVTGLLLHPYGLLAVPFGGIAGETLACYHFVVKDACNVLKENYARFAVRLWAGVATISSSAFIAGWLGHSIAIGPTPLRWAEVGLLTSLAAILSGWGLGLSKDERLHLARWWRFRRSSKKRCEVLQIYDEVVLGQGGEVK